MSLPRFTIEAELSKEGLLEVRSAIDQLLTELGESSSASSRDGLMLHADRKVGEVWTRVGENLKRFLVYGAQLNARDDAEFSMNDIAAGLRTPVKTVRSWHRNLGRTLRQVDVGIPEPPIMIGRWDGARQQYRFPPEVRKAILDRHAASGGSSDLALDAELRAIEAQIDKVPAVALSAAVQVLERELGRRLASLAIELPDDEPTLHVLVEAGRHSDLVDAQTVEQLLQLVKLRNRAGHDPSGTKTKPEDARRALAVVRSVLATMETATLRQTRPPS